MGARIRQTLMNLDEVLDSNDIEAVVIGLGLMSRATEPIYRLRSAL